MTLIKKIPFQNDDKIKLSSVEVFLYETDKETQKSTVQFADNKIVFILKDIRRFIQNLKK